LNGWDVRVFDPDPEAARKLGAVLENARRALPGLYERALPAEGELTYCETLSEAVAGATWIQESVPERLALKQKVYQTLQESCAADAVIGSSTSGFKPSELQSCATRSGQILVAHPFNPVYLLPLVELVATDANPPEIVDKAAEVLRGIGMYPLRVRQEIDAHIADRFLEAVWREALWLVKDGVATTEEIDDAIRYGFGLRWAQMGLFETYRIAGGEAGMKHFIAQFGPALSWPWTKLMDVPELTEALIDTISAQSDAQAAGASIRDLERRRDANLVAMIRALKAQGTAAGRLVAEHEAGFEAPGAEASVPAGEDKTAGSPVETVRRHVPLDWVDYNGHMNEARYLQAFGDATDRFMELIGCDADYIASGGSYFTAETHIRHLDEVHAGAELRITTQVLLGQGKKMHLWHEMRSGERLLATGEHMLIHVSLETRRAAAPSEEVARALAQFASRHSALPRPDGAGRAVGTR